VDDQAAVVDLDVDVLFDVHARKLQPNHRVLAVLGDLSGGAEPAGYRLDPCGRGGRSKEIAHPAVDIRRGS
jgi:hypothetical protein